MDIKRVYGLAVGLIIKQIGENNLEAETSILFACTIGRDIYSPLWILSRSSYKVVLYYFSRNV